MRDKTKKNAWQRDYYRTHPYEQKVRYAASAARARAKTKENAGFLLAYKETHPCIDCGEADPVVLQFDHIDPAQKRGNVSSFCSHKPSMMRELAKCVVRCANCHARRSYKEGHYRGILHL